MADTTVKIDDTTRDILRELADAQGLTIKDYLARLADEKQQERALATATAVFRRVINEPGIMEAFDAEFGGLPPVAHSTRQVA
ncbi:antitoxin MazE7 [Streptomyces hyaluromycini]|uniref:antitoxin MazE7 n=1 Tax=Streptomyces hyaluromycini TaxID=1377993 RepID=UPI000B5C69F5|nr:antitoxin MazE7 [Streptomyces hyaluromycini]